MTVLSYDLVLNPTFNILEREGKLQCFFSARECHVRAAIVVIILRSSPCHCNFLHCKACVWSPEFASGANDGALLVAAVGLLPA